jgi:hypothetical protein
MIMPVRVSVRRIGVSVHVPVVDIAHADIGDVGIGHGPVAVLRVISISVWIAVPVPPRWISVIAIAVPVTAAVTVAVMHVAVVGPVLMIAVVTVIAVRSSSGLQGHRKESQA